MRITGLKKEHFKLWNDLAGSSEGSGFMQSWEWSEFKEAEGAKVERLGIFDSGKLIAGAIVYRVETSLGVSPLAMPHGPVLPWKDAVKAGACYNLLRKKLEAMAERTGSPVARLEPFISSRPAFLGPALRAPLDLVPTPTLLVGLGGDDAGLLAAMTQKGRYNVRLAERKGVEVASSQTNDLTGDFHELFELTCSRHSFHGEPVGFFNRLTEALGPAGMARTYLASYQGMPAAAAVAVFFGGKATYLYGGTSPFLRHTMASYAMHWRIMRDARDKGMKLYDMYGVAPTDQPHHPYAKFSAFKARFGGTMVRTIGAQDIYFYPQLAKTLVSRLAGTQGAAS
ncbi:MAG: peptidoglycan bridge formation glycyltransferase FemA/FemB family protein [Elusimicrobiota bacterium]|nr:peptidoglycan bridge formation glycyltransferase FemA/FemB family protein [Elusimicrobiota bacterium]